MLHARYREEGLRADAGNLSLDEFVQGKIEEEVEAVIQTIQAKRALQKVGYDFSGVNYPPTEDDYLKAYEASERAAIVQSQRTTSMDFGSQRDQAGRKRLLRGFWAGEVRISTTHEPYDEYYKRCWQIADLLRSILGSILTPLGLQNIADLEIGQEAVNLVSNSC
jgi:hypothetical protein